MHYQTDENSEEVLQDFSQELTSNHSEKPKKRKKKVKTDDALNLPMTSEVLSQKPEDLEKEKRKKKKHIYEREHEIGISCSGDHVLVNENLPMTEISTEKKKKIKKHQLDKEVESGDGHWLLEPVSTAVSEHEPDPETSSKPKKKKKKHRKEKENEIAIQIENIHTVSNELIKTENEDTCNTTEVENEGCMLPNDNLPEPEPETSHKQKNKKKRRHEKEDEIGSSAVSGENVVLESTKVQKKKRNKDADNLFKNLYFDINWIFAPVDSPEEVTLNEVQDEINTSQLNRENKTDWVNSSVDRSIVELSQGPSDNVPSALNVPSQEALVDVPSVIDSPVELSENVPASLNVTSQESSINLPFANNSPVEPSVNAPSALNVPSTTNYPSTQNSRIMLSQKASINVPSTRDSPVDLSQKTSGNVSLTRDSVIRLSKDHSSNLQPEDNLPVDLSRKSSAKISVVRDSRIHQFQKHSANESSVDNSVTVSFQVGPSSNCHSAKRRLFAVEDPNELAAGFSKTSPPTRRVRCVKTCTIEAPEGYHAVSKNSLPAVSKNSRPEVSMKSIPVKRVRCVKTCTIATQEDISTNAQPGENSVKRRCARHRSSSPKKQEKRTRHPDLPKQPASVYVRFMSECRKELLEQKPNLTPVQVFIEAGNRYRQLKDVDKAKYVNEFLRETKEYNVAIKKFLENHPEHRNRWAAEKRNSLEKHKSGKVEIISGHQLYINKRTREHLATHAGDNIRSVMAFYRKEWKQGPSDQEKVVYILEAKKLNAENAAAVEGPKTMYSDGAEQISACSYSEIEEQFLQENLVAPPVNGYQLFLKENANSELPFGEINRKWKTQLSQEERNSYTMRAKLARETYKKNVAEFEKKEELEAEFQNLPLPNKLRNTLKEEHKLLASVRKKANEKPKKYPNIRGRPPINGRRLFFKERMPTVKDLDFKLRFAELNSQWKHQLSQEERDEYAARAKAAYDKFMEEHPELRLDEGEEESAEQDYRTSHDCLEKTQTSKRRQRQNEGEPKLPRKKRQHISEDVLQMGDVTT